MTITMNDTAGYHKAGEDANVNGDHMPIDDVNRIEVDWHVDSMGDDAVKVKALQTLLDNLLGGRSVSAEEAHSVIILVMVTVIS